MKGRNKPRKEPKKASFDSAQRRDKVRTQQKNRDRRESK